MADTDRWNSAAAYESDVGDEGYLDEAEHAHGMELWSLALIFETPVLSMENDTKYNDVSVTIINNWKVVKFELGRWDQQNNYWRAGVDLYAVIK